MTLRWVAVAPGAALMLAGAALASVMPIHIAGIGIWLAWVGVFAIIPALHWAIEAKS